jgi:MFS family permease
VTRLRAAGADTFRSLRVRNFRLFFVGQSLSQVGTWMQMVAIAYVVLDLTDSGVMLGLATAAQFGPILVLGAWAGVLADRLDRHRLLLGLNVAGAVVGALFAALVLTGSAELWSVFLLTAAAGTVSALENPARRAFVADLVAERDIANAVGLNSTLMTGSRVIGPAVAGLLVAGPGMGWPFAVNALSYLPQLWLFVRMDRDRFRPTERAPRGRGQLREGLRYVWRTPELRLPLVLVAVVGTLAFNHSVVLPLFAERTLSGGPGTFATMFSVMSLGSMAGALVVARRTTTDTRFLALSSLALGASMLALAAAPTLWVAMVLSLPVGATSVLVIAGANTTIQLTATPVMRGRVLALMAVVFLGSTPIGGPIAGWVSEAWDARAGLAMGAVASLGAALWTLRALRRLAPTPRVAATGTGPALIGDPAA